MHILMYIIRILLHIKLYNKKEIELHTYIMFNKLNNYSNAKAKYFSNNNYRDLFEFIE